MTKKPHPLDGARSMMGALQTENTAALIKPPVAEAPPSPAPVASPALPAPRQGIEATGDDAPKPVGRPKSGKKSDPSYVQTSILIKDETRLRVKQALLGAGNGQDVSQLVQSLLEEWLESR